MVQVGAVAVAVIIPFPYRHSAILFRHGGTLIVSGSELTAVNLRHISCPPPLCGEDYCVYRILGARLLVIPLACWWRVNEASSEPSLAWIRSLRYTVVAIPRTQEMLSSFERCLIRHRCFCVLLSVTAVPIPSTLISSAPGTNFNSYLALKPWVQG